ncbi:DNA primase [Neobacillus piezotolerans]|uniref:DNA primase n=1 Tax=Neobacillus piezotolerans TaxID=2259171 RepID=A0A3D8GL84_9BACI|nr:YrrS family protein [Neobacillus piezotolerans]RDU35111.1 DNA primase [Neobacillus piezotolerans]
MDHDFSNKSRLRYRAKRKKTNIILNSLIAIVILLILAVGFSIFAGNDDAAPKNPDKAETGQKAGNTEKGDTGGDTAGGASQDSSDADSSADTDDESQTAEENVDEADEPVVTEGGSSENVKRTIENPGWKPVGTSQSGDHQVTIDSSSPDWDEMHSALAYAIGTDKGNMTTWWLERDKSKEGGAIGTVTAKGSDQAYRVYIEWVDGEGYKPVKVEELYENDKK